MHQLRAFSKAFADLMRLKLFQIRQKKEAAISEHRAKDLHVRFESQKQKPKRMPSKWKP
jgi:hypothetical protein